LKFKDTAKKEILIAKEQFSN